MNTRYTVRIILLLFIIFVLYKTLLYLQLKEAQLDQEIAAANSPKTKISVHYEALCPDSRFFVAYQLLPVFKDFQKYVSLELIPYGKAQTIETDGKIDFKCQHDAVECFANKIHSCVIELVEDPLVQLEYITCMIRDNSIPEDAGERCGKEFNLNFSPISKCANGIQGSNLLKKHGERTNSLNPPVKFIPTIELDDSQTLVPQTQILKDFKKALCTVLKNKPSKCL